MTDLAPPLAEEPEFISRREAQKRLGLSSRSFFDLVCAEQFEVRRVGRDLQVKATDVADYVQGHGQAPPQPDPVVVPYDPAQVYLSLEVASHRLGVSRRELIRMAWSEALPLARRANGEIVIPLWAIEKTEQNDA